MPHIKLPEGLPGILGPMAFRPETAKPLNELAEILLRGPSSLSPGEREPFPRGTIAFSARPFMARWRLITLAAMSSSSWM
jgi:hypothetical protein